MHRTRDERGATAVEFALVLPVLLVLLFGIMEVGRLFQVQATLSAAAREGVRVMAVQDDPDAARTAVLTTATSLSPVLRADEVVVDPGRCTDPSATATVLVHYTAPSLTGLYGGWDLTGQAAMRCGG
ncbi:TadE/TadG family type IV pilus assembly protein [Modestobacter sp. Leaf380]|uniref:TadE/TadG family type IV pilus assembly protein n=1 Tax=Modestobacter sp. Leaf380 TaxID=1736356 RepID=UPI0006FDBFE9|nr:TadE/TadG family type IV pilus assembly protein [Modestobacter sp. Leaf380]KQS66293.1 hypothetical protein ASG41_13360 [Modestobacter sp. Leaf380]